MFRKAASQEVHESPDSQMSINILSSLDVIKDMESASKISRVSAGRLPGQEQQNRSGVEAGEADTPPSAE